MVNSATLFWPPGQLGNVLDIHIEVYQYWILIPQANQGSWNQIPLRAPLYSLQNSFPKIVYTHAIFDAFEICL